MVERPLQCVSSPQTVPADQTHGGNDVLRDCRLNRDSKHASTSHRHANVDMQHANGAMKEASHGHALTSTTLEWSDGLDKGPGLLW